VEKPVEQTVDLREEDVIVERRPINREATDQDLANSQERVFEIRRIAEEPVVQKTARVVEEVEIGRDTRQRQETVRDTVKRTDVEIQEDVEQQGGLPPGAAPRRDRRPRP
jgi:stress response protein YsnF